MLAGFFSRSHSRHPCLPETAPPGDPRLRPNLSRPNRAHVVVCVVAHRLLGSLCAMGKPIMQIDEAWDDDPRRMAVGMGNALRDSPAFSHRDPTPL